MKGDPKKPLCPECGAMAYWGGRLYGKDGPERMEYWCLKNDHWEQPMQEIDADRLTASEPAIEPIGTPIYCVLGQCHHPGHHPADVWIEGYGCVCLAHVPDELKAMAAMVRLVAG